MDVEKVLRAGYFDRIKIDGILKPVYEGTGTSIVPFSSFKESLNKSEEAFKHGVAHLKIQLIGECDTNINFVDLTNMREDREKCGIQKVASTTEDVDRYLVGYADILILKGEYAIPYKIEANGKTTKDIEKLAKTPDTLDIMLAALKLGKYITKKYEYPPDWVNIGIVDKVYAYPIFRRCEISTWIHENIADIINMYSLVWASGILLTYGDFSDEAESVFKQSESTYNKMLLNHYKQLGYHSISKLGLDGLIGNSKLMYKLMV